MNLSNEFVSVLVSLLIPLLANLAIKFLETRKSKEELDKTALEAADLSFDFLKESLAIAVERIQAQRNELEEKDIKIKKCMDEIEVLCEQIKALKKGEEHNALRNT